MKPCNAFFITVLVLVAAANAQRCPIGTFRDPTTGQCAGANTGIMTGQGCFIGQFRDPVSGQCVGPTVGANASPTQQCPPGMAQDLFTGQCSPYRNWFCSLCKECCYNDSTYRHIYECHYDQRGNFEGCLTDYGFARPTITNLLRVRYQPQFLPALLSFVG